MKKELFKLVLLIILAAVLLALAFALGNVFRSGEPPIPPAGETIGHLIRFYN